MHVISRLYFYNEHMLIMSIFTMKSILTNKVTRVEVWSKNNVRLAVNSGENNFHRKAPASFGVECGDLL